MKRQAAAGVFITGTDTGVGKTFIAGLLVRYLRDAGMRVLTHKWVQSGDSDDVASHERTAGTRNFRICPTTVRTSYRFPLAASPHLSAESAGRRITPQRIVCDFRRLQRQADLIIAEGSGGVLVPYTRRRYLIDVAVQLHLPVVVVVDNRLGAINHALLSLEAIRRRRLPVAGLVFTHCRPPEKESFAVYRDNLRIISGLGQSPVWGCLPYALSPEQQYAGFRRMLSSRSGRCGIKTILSGLRSDSGRSLSRAVFNTHEDQPQA